MKNQIIKNDDTKTSNPNNLLVLVNKIKAHLNASDVETEAQEEFIVTTDTSDTQKPIIKTKYKNPRIKKDSIASGKPSQDGKYITLGLPSMSEPGEPPPPLPGLPFKFFIIKRLTNIELRFKIKLYIHKRRVVDL